MVKGWRKIQFKDIASGEKHSFIDGDWIESEHIKDTGIRIIQTGNIGIGRYLDKPEHKKYISKDSFKTLNCKKVYPKDLLICRLADPIGRACLAPDKDNYYVTAVDVVILREDGKKFNKKFLLFLLNYEPTLKSSAELAAGSTRQRVSRTNLGKLSLEIPESIPEQSKIAEILTKIDKAIEQTEAIIEKQKRIKTGLMQDLLTKGIDEHGNIRSEETHEFKDSLLGRIPVEWEASPLHKYTEIKVGFAFKSTDYVEEGTQLIRIGNLFGSKLSLTREPVYLPNSYKREYSDFILRKGDILMSMTGTVGKRDYGFAVQIEKGREFLLNQRVCKFVPNDDIHIGFLLVLLHSEIYLKELYDQAGGTKQANLNISNILDIIVPIPKFDEQERIGEAIAQLERIQEHEFLVLGKLILVKAGLIHDFLTGKVRVTDLLKSRKKNLKGLYNATHR